MQSTVCFGWIIPLHLFGCSFYQVFSGSCGSWTFIWLNMKHLTPQPNPARTVGEVWKVARKKHTESGFKVCCISGAWEEEFHPVMKFAFPFKDFSQSCTASFSGQDLTPLIYLFHLLDCPIAHHLPTACWVFMRHWEATQTSLIGWLLSSIILKPLWGLS